MLSDGSNSKGYNNSVVLLTEGDLNFEKGMASIEHYCMNGGKFTILCIGDSVKRNQLSTLFSSIPQVKILAIEEEGNLVSLIRQLL